MSRGLKNNLFWLFTGLMGGLLAFSILFAIALLPPEHSDNQINCVAGTVMQADGSCTPQEMSP